MSALLRTVKTREEESEEDLKVAVILAMVDMLEEVSHIQPEQKKIEEQKEPKKKREFEPADFEDPILYIDDMSYSEEKEIKRLMTNCKYVARKVTFSDIDHLCVFPPPPPPSAVERTLNFIRKVGRFICITDNDEDEFELEEEESFLDYRSYGFT